MTTQPGACDRSAESWGVGVWAATGKGCESVSKIRKTRLLTTETRSRGEQRGMYSAAALGCGRTDCPLVSWFGLEDHTMENSCDLLMENASHSGRIYGDTNLRSRWGTAVRWGHNCTAVPHR